MSDDDKNSKFLAKIYYEMQQCFKELSAEIKEIKKETHRNTVWIDFIEHEIEQLGIKVSNNLIPINSSILEGIKNTNEHIIRLDDKIHRLQINANNLMIKAADNNRRIIRMSRNLKKLK